MVRTVATDDHSRLLFEPSHALGIDVSHVMSSGSDRPATLVVLLGARAKEKCYSGSRTPVPPVRTGAPRKVFRLPG